MRISFVTWYPSCRRSDTLAAALGGTSHLIHYMRFKQPLYAPFKYVMQSFATWRTLLRERPDVVLVASPPVFAVLTVYLYCRIFRAEYIIDAHTGVFDDKRWTWLAPLSGFLARAARVSIVTNSHLSRQVEDWRAHALIIGDVPVEFPSLEGLDLGAGLNVVVINTFSADEPLDEILAAAAMLPDVRFHVTGNLKHSRNAFTTAPPPNVRFTGWVSDDTYSQLLRSADVVMCLTKHDHTMQRGAYEAMAVGKPLITSNWGLLRETFSAGTIHVDNSPADIARAVRAAAADLAALRTEMKQLADQRKYVFNEKLGQLRALLD